MQSMRRKSFLSVVPIFLIISGCFINKPFQPPPHPAELWQKNGDFYDFNSVFDDLKDCGWVSPRDNLDKDGKIKFELYQAVDRCMVNKGYKPRVLPKEKTRLF